MKRLFAFLLLAAPLALAQVAVRVDIPLQTSGPFVPVTGGPLPQALWVANATVAICSHAIPASQSYANCVATPITTYTDATMATPCSPATPLVQLPGNTCTSSTGITSTLGIWYGGGVFDYYLVTKYGTFGPYTYNTTSGGVPGSLGLTTTLTPTSDTIQATLNSGQTNILLTPGTYVGPTSIPSGTTIKCLGAMLCTLNYTAPLTIGVDGGLPTFFEASLIDLVLDFGGAPNGLTLNDVLYSTFSLTIHNTPGTALTMKGTCSIPGDWTTCALNLHPSTSTAFNNIEYLNCEGDQNGVKPLGQCLVLNGDDNITCGASQHQGGAVYGNDFGTILGKNLVGANMITLTSGIDSNDFHYIFVTSAANAASNGIVFGSRCPLVYGDIDSNHFDMIITGVNPPGEAVIANASHGTIDFLWPTRATNRSFPLSSYSSDGTTLTIHNSGANGLMGGEILSFVAGANDPFTNLNGNTGIVSTTGLTSSQFNLVTLPTLSGVTTAVATRTGGGTFTLTGYSSVASTITLTTASTAGLSPGDTVTIASTSADLLFSLNTHSYTVGATVTGTTFTIPATLSGPATGTMTTTNGWVGNGADAWKVLFNTGDPYNSAITTETIPQTCWKAMTGIADNAPNVTGTITAWAYGGGTLTLTAPNNFVAGELVTFSVVESNPRSITAYSEAAGVTTFTGANTFAATHATANFLVSSSLDGLYPINKQVQGPYGGTPTTFLVTTGVLTASGSTTATGKVGVGVAGVTYPITSYSVSGDTLTLNATNSFSGGETIKISAIITDPLWPLNGETFTVSSPTGSHFAIPNGLITGSGSSTANLDPLQALQGRTFAVQSASSSQFTITSSLVTTTSLITDSTSAKAASVGDSTVFCTFSARATVTDPTHDHLKNKWRQGIPANTAATTHGWWLDFTYNDGLEFAHSDSTWTSMIPAATTGNNHTITVPSANGIMALTDSNGSMAITSLNTTGGIVVQGTNSVVGSNSVINAMWGIVPPAATSVAASNAGRIWQVAGGTTLLRTADTGTIARAAQSSVGQTTLAAGAATVYTSAPSFFCAGPPLAGTNVTITNPWCFEGLGANFFGSIQLGGALTPLAARKGTFVCSGAGTITITNANEQITSDVIISLNTAGGTITTPPAMKTVTASTGFTVLCGATDTSTYNYDILN